MAGIMGDGSWHNGRWCMYGEEASDTMADCIMTNELNKADGMTDDGS